jgi:precorrin-6B methylase 2
MQQKYEYDDWNLLFKTMNSYIYHQALVTACDLDLFGILEDEPGLSAASIQGRLGLQAYPTRVLLLSCSSTGLIFRDKETLRYYNSSAASKFLLKNSDYSMLPFIKFNDQIQRRTLLHFTESLKENSNCGLREFPGDGQTLYERIANSYPELEALFQNALGSYTYFLSKPLWDLNDFSEVRLLLDIGGGDGTNAINLCKRHPSLNVIIGDTQTVCKKARINVNNHNLSDRITIYPIDAFNQDWPKGADAILMSHFVEIFSEEKIMCLYRKAYEYLPKGGRFIIWAAITDDVESGALQSAKSSMYFLNTASGEGMTYPKTDHCKWLNAAGFHIKNIHEVSDIEHIAFVCTRE